MNTLSLNTNCRLNSNIYWSILKGLSADVKLELISKLSASLIISNDTTEDNATKWTSSFAGRWQDDRSADEIVDDIRASRTTNRELPLKIG